MNQILILPNWIPAAMTKANSITECAIPSPHNNTFNQLIINYLPLLPLKTSAKLTILFVFNNIFILPLRNYQHNYMLRNFANKG